MPKWTDGRDGLEIEPLDIYPSGRAVVREILAGVPGEGCWSVDETIMRISEEGL